MGFWPGFLIGYFVGGIATGAGIIGWGVMLCRRDTCKHIWVERCDQSRLSRRCMKCEATEIFEPDASGWTAGHWDRVETKGQ